MEICAYCGEEIVDKGLEMDDLVFCSQECLEAYSEEILGYPEEDEIDI